MTNEEAIKDFKFNLEVFGGKHKEAMIVGIDALEKQIPMRFVTKVLKYGDSVTKSAHCARCKAGLDWDEGLFCWKCGQKIDWSEE